MNLKKLPIDISSFEIMIKNNYLYIDKTQYIYNIFIAGSRYHFLSRPRRFGKSLLVSTLKELFLGNKELFKDLWIYSSDYDWQEYPVIDLDFSTIPHLDATELRRSINNKLKWIAQQNNLNLNNEVTPEETLDKLIGHLSKINKVVILIDEYDKPILDHIKNLEEAEAQREILKSFYSVIKGQGANLRAVFLTGVSKFARASVFSGLNNLNDLTLDPIASKLLGYTEQEILENLMPYIESFAQCEEISLEYLIQKLKNWYNGYRFSRLDIKIYNPFSVLYALNKQELNNYWISSGNPEFLIVLLKQQYQKLENIEQAEFAYNSLEVFDIDKINIVTLLVQTGYLTISEYNKEHNSFKVKLPNFEVRQAFTSYIIAIISKYNADEASNKLLELRTAIEQNNLIHFFEMLESIFAHIPYTMLQNLNKEKDYHMLLQLILSLLSISAQSEVLTNTGRIDLVLQTKTNTYVFEFKLNQSAQIALQQIKDKKYYQRFLGQDKKITLIGINFVNIKDKTELDFITEDVDL